MSVGLIERIRGGSCEETRECLSEHLEGELGGRRERRVIRHLARCDRCRAVLRSLAKTVEQLRSLARDPEPPLASVADAVIVRVRSGALLEPPHEPATG